MVLAIASGLPLCRNLYKLYRLMDTTRATLFVLDALHRVGPPPFPPRALDPECLA